MLTKTRNVCNSLLILVIALTLSACATVRNPVSGENEFTVLDEKSELALGKQEHEQVLQEYSVYNNPKLQDYVNQLGQHLAQQSHRANIEWHFTVLDSTEINAFALPGGYVYVTRGIMAYLGSEAELAGVIGHEIGHVTARHGAQRATRQKAAGFGVLAVGILGAVLEMNGYGGIGEVANQVSQGVAAGYIASYGRDQELQADRLGAEYLSRTEYDPKRMVDVITVLKNHQKYEEDRATKEGKTLQTGPSWLASHPSNDRRLQDITVIANQYDGNTTHEGRASYLQAIRGMNFGESKEQGVTRGQHFYHEPLGIALSAPDGWRIKNSNDAITLENKAADAALIVKVVPPKLGSTHNDIIRNVFKPRQGQADQLTLNGFPATHFVGMASNAKGQSQKIEVTVVTVGSGDASKNFILGYTAKDAQTLQRHRDKLKEAENSFRPLSAAERDAARPWIIKTVAYPKGGFAQLAQKSPLTGDAESMLRLLNGFYSGGEPKAGELVKIVE